MASALGGESAIGLNGMVSTPHPFASQAGIDVLREGGSAFDAVVAANAVLTVVYPDQTALGGDCFFIHYQSTSGELSGFNGSGAAPANADREELRSRGWLTIPQHDIAAVTVPGTIDAWWQGHARFGRLAMERLLAPAIALAENGFPVGATLAEAWPAAPASTRAAFGGNYRYGDRLAQPKLAHSFRQLVREGRDCFYQGAIGEQILATSRALGGSMTADDLSGHIGEWVQPVIASYRGQRYAELPPNSQGITAQLAMNMVERQPAHPFGTSSSIHLQVEAKKRAFAQRNCQLGDPRFVPVDNQRFVSDDFAAECWSGFDPDHAQSAEPARDGDTVYLCAVDREGNSASLIQSIYLGFGSGIFAGDTGILLHCRGAYFSLDDDSPNRIEGGKRPLHTLMPAMLQSTDGHWSPFGTQGGDHQAQVHMQLLGNLVDHFMHPQEAIDAPRWVSGLRANPDPLLVRLENRISGGTAAELESRGHHIDWGAAFDGSFGHAQMILREPERGLLIGGADKRLAGLALGW